jgi:hypothetical protein
MVELNGIGLSAAAVAPRPAAERFKTRAVRVDLLNATQDLQSRITQDRYRS